MNEDFHENFDHDSFGQQNVDSFCCQTYRIQTTFHTPQNLIQNDKIQLTRIRKTNFICYKSKSQLSIRHDLYSLRIVDVLHLNGRTDGTKWINLIDFEMLIINWNIYLYWPAEKWMGAEGPRDRDWQQDYMFPSVYAYVCELCIVNVST